MSSAEQKENKRPWEEHNRGLHNQRGKLFHFKGRSSTVLAVSDAYKLVCMHSLDSKQHIQTLASSKTLINQSGFRYLDSIFDS